MLLRRAHRKCMSTGLILSNGNYIFEIRSQFSQLRFTIGPPMQKLQLQTAAKRWEFTNVHAGRVVDLYPTSTLFSCAPRILTPANPYRKIVPPNSCIADCGLAVRVNALINSVIITGNCHQIICLVLFSKRTVSRLFGVYKSQFLLWHALKLVYIFEQFPVKYSRNPPL